MDHFKRGGGQYTLKAKPENVKLIDEFLYITFPSSSNQTLNRMVIGGWKNDERSRIFGMLFMYINENYMSTGVSISFDSGEGDFLPSKAREIVSNKHEIRKVTNEVITGLIEQLGAISVGLKNKESYLSGLISKKPLITTIYTTIGHPAHPAVFTAFRRKVDIGAATLFRTVFLGDESEAKKLHNNFKLDYENGLKTFNSEMIKFLDGKY